MEKNDKDQDLYPDMTSTVSATECTGMFATPPLNTEEYESLQDMYGMEIPKKSELKKK